MHLGAIAQHPTCEEGVVGIRFEGENAIGDVGEGIGEEPNVCTDVDGNPAAVIDLSTVGAQSMNGPIFQKGTYCVYVWDANLTMTTTETYTLTVSHP